MINALLLEFFLMTCGVVCTYAAYRENSPGIGMIAGGFIASAFFVGMLILIAFHYENTGCSDPSHKGLSIDLGVDGLNYPALCGVIVASDHSTRGALARWGAGKVRPGRPLKPAKMIFRFSHKTMCALITSVLWRLDRHQCSNCRFHGGETYFADGETGNFPGYIVSL